LQSKDLVNDRISSAIDDNIIEIAFHRIEWIRTE